jgi:putative N-acetylmannosamine-6-phosphate epimerase
MHRLLKIMKKRFALVVSLPRNLPSLARAARDAGADALKVHINVHHRASGTTFGSWNAEKENIERIITESGIPVGIVPGAETLPTWTELHEIIASGIDLIDLYAHHMPTSWLALDGASRMVAMDDSHPLDLAKSLERLGADIIEAAVVPHEGYGDTLSVLDLAIYRELSSYTDLPILVPSQRRIVPGDLRFLKRAGASGVMIGAVVTGLTEEGIAEATAAFRSALDSLDA